MQGESYWQEKRDEWMNQYPSSYTGYINPQQQEKYRLENEYNKRKRKLWHSMNCDILAEFFMCVFGIGGRKLRNFSSIRQIVISSYHKKCSRAYNEVYGLGSNEDLF